MSATARTYPDCRHDDRCEIGVRDIGDDPPHRCHCAVREVAWVAREALAIIQADVATISDRHQAFTARKHALLAYIRATE